MTDEITPPRRARAKTRRKPSFVRDFVISIGIALVLSLLLKTFLVQAFFIPSASMQDTLTEGDRILVNKLVPGQFDLSRGDIVVFEDPGGWLPPSMPETRNPVSQAVSNVLSFVGLVPQGTGDHLIKRVIGLPGDTVECCSAEGKVIVNGKPIDEPYVASGDVPSVKPFKVIVPPGKLWVMGDHRSDSKDSRYNGQTDLGFVPMDNVVGVAFVIVWPISAWEILHNPADTFQKVPAASE